MFYKFYIQIKRWFKIGSHSGNLRVFLFISCIIFLFSLVWDVNVMYAIYLITFALTIISSMCETGVIMHRI